MKRTYALMAALAIIASSTWATPAAATPKPNPPKVGEISAPSVLGPLPWVNAASNDCLDQSFAGGIEHPDVNVISCHFGPNQLWNVNYRSDGLATVTNQRTGKCLDQNFTNGVEHPDVDTFACHGGPNQLWQVTSDSANQFTFRNVRTGKCLDQSFPNGVKHPDVTAFPCHGGPNQKWI